MRKVIFKHISNNNNLFHFPQRCYRLGDTGMSFRLILRMHNFPILHMFFKCRFWTTGYGFQNTKRGFSSRHTDLQKNPSVFQYLSRIGR